MPVRITPMPSLPLAARIARFGELLTMVVPIPEEWKVQVAASGITEGGMGCLPCACYHDLVTAWRKALRWTDGLDHALAVMLASISSTKAVGDQLWIKVIGPAACGKSTLCEALSVSSLWVVAKSTIRGFHSGFRADGDGSGRDWSLIPTIKDKTLVTKDGDTLLQSPNLPQILSEARDLYDSTARTHYRNATSRDYAGIRMTWILCGTSALRVLDTSELGERFLDCVIMEHIDDELEDEILWRVANRADRNMAIEADGKPETHYEPELAEAMRLTGGYVNWLREHAAERLTNVTAEDGVKRQCMRLGKFVALMRARPSRRQEESAEREFAARLVSQLIRLGKCLALVLNRSALDATVMQRVRRVAMDTARGQTLAIIAHLYHTAEGLQSQALGALLGRSEEKVKALLRFLRGIGAVDYVKLEAPGRALRSIWRLSSRMRQLYDEVFGNA